MAGVYSVAQVNSYIKNMFAQDFLLRRLSVKGEVSNCKYHSSGHIYFTLKDGGGTLQAVMFASQRRGLNFKLAEGQQVVVKGTVDVYERDGKYQLYASEIELSGRGDLYLRFEKLLKELEEMGMFDPQYKRPIPRFAKTVGIVTAPTGAAIRDIMNISHRRNPYVQLILYPALVQGDGAKDSIVKGIRTLDAMGLDVLIVGNHLECHCDLHFCTFLFKNFSHVSVRFKRSASLQPIALRWCHSAAARFGRHRQNPVKASLLKM